MISEELNKIITTKESIRQAIETKGVAVDTTAPFSSYSDRILEIETGSSETWELEVQIPQTSFSSRSKVINLFISSSKAWTLSIPDWVTASTTSGKGPLNIQLIIAANLENERGGELIVTETNGESKSYFLTQYGADTHGMIILDFEEPSALAMTITVKKQLTSRTGSTPQTSYTIPAGTEHYEVDLGDGYYCYQLGTSAAYGTTAGYTFCDVTIYGNFDLRTDLRLPLNTFTVYGDIRVCANVRLSQYSNVKYIKCNYIIYEYNTTLAFANSSKLIEIQCQQMDVSIVTSLASFFINNNCMTSQPKMVFGSSILNLSSIFQNCFVIEEVDLTGIAAESCTTTAAMFNACYRLKNIIGLSDLIISNSLTNAKQMFLNCYQLETIDCTHIDFSSCIDVSSFAQNCYSLTKVIGCETLINSSVTNASNAFSYCLKLVDLDTSQFDISSCTSFNWDGMTSMEKMDLRFLATRGSSALSWGSYFVNANTATNLRAVYLDGVDFSGMSTTTTSWFNTAYFLENIEGSFTGIKNNISMTHPNYFLTRESMVNIFNALATFTSGTHTLTIGKDIYSRLTTEDLAIATAKKWTIKA